MREEITTTQTPKTPEKKDHFMELMERRHEGALVAMEIENILGEEVGDTGEYPTIVILDNEVVRERAGKELKPIVDRLNKEKAVRINDYWTDNPLVVDRMRRADDDARAAHKVIAKRDVILESVENYLIKKVEAKRAEFKLKKLAIGNNSNLGRELFKLKTKREPLGAVEVERLEGYLVVICEKDEDYEIFKGDSRKSAGEFHNAVRYPEIGADLLVIRGGDTQNAQGVLRHERQHFINHSMFKTTKSSAGEKLFGDLENPSPLNKKAYYAGTKRTALEGYGATHAFERIDTGLRAIKDEVLSYLRDGSSADQITEFLKDPIYSSLKTPFHVLEFEEVNKLMDKIKIELKGALEVFNFSDFSRGVLVYHLIDIPLIKFPERIRAVVEFYNKKMARFNKENLVEDTWSGIMWSISEPDPALSRKLRTCRNGISFHLMKVRELLGFSESVDAESVTDTTKEQRLDDLFEAMKEARKKFETVLAKAKALIKNEKLEKAGEEIEEAYERQDKKEQERF